MSSAQPAGTNSPRKYQLLIDGQWVDAESGKTFTTPNPSTGETLAEVAEADKADIDKAVKAARKSLRRQMVQDECSRRGRLMYKTLTVDRRAH